MTEHICVQRNATNQKIAESFPDTIASWQIFPVFPYSRRHQKYNRTITIYECCYSILVGYYRVN